MERLLITKLILVRKSKHHRSSISPKKHLKINKFQKLPQPDEQLEAETPKAWRMYYRTARTGNAPCTCTGIAAPALAPDSQGQLPCAFRVLHGVSPQMNVSAPASHHQDTLVCVHFSAHNWQNASEAPVYKTCASPAALYGWVSLCRCRRKGIRLETLGTLTCLRSAVLHVETCRPPNNCSILGSRCRIFGACSYIGDRIKRRYWPRSLQWCLSRRSPRVLSTAFQVRHLSPTWSLWRRKAYTSS